ncbi:MAG: S8 family serine peptidase [Bdellovibrionota bacterium]
MKIFANLMLVVTAATLLTSCNSMDDQTIVIPERQSLANPSVVKRDFKRINSQHKVLVGIIDSGVDYNQPLLVENIHFKLNDFVSLPSGFGYDVSGEDVWASPFIARTSDYNPEIGPTEKLKSQTEANNIAQLLRENPEFESFLNPLRHNVQEIETSAYHGTHVAGLASYDDPEIGILGYRVIPFSSKYKNGELLEQDMGDLFIDQIIAGSSAAVRDGARVLNMSLGMIVDKNYEDLKKSEESETKHKARVAKLRQFALANPDVVIVVAAGNDGKWVDQDARLGLPCGTDAPNILCVGATDENGKIASFTNILMTEGAFIFGYGVNVLSTVPESLHVKICFSTCKSRDVQQHRF